MQKLGSEKLRRLSEGIAERGGVWRQALFALPPESVLLAPGVRSISTVWDGNAGTVGGSQRPWVIAVALALTPRVGLYELCQVSRTYFPTAG